MIISIRNVNDEAYKKFRKYCIQRELTNGELASVVFENIEIVGKFLETTLGARKNEKLRNANNKKP